MNYLTTRHIADITTHPACCSKDEFEEFTCITYEETAQYCKSSITVLTQNYQVGLRTVNSHRDLTPAFPPVSLRPAGHKKFTKSHKHSRPRCAHHAHNHNTAETSTIPPSPSPRSARPACPVKVCVASKHCPAPHALSSCEAFLCCLVGAAEWAAALCRRLLMALLHARRHERASERAWRRHQHQLSPESRHGETKT